MNLQPKKKIKNNKSAGDADTMTNSIVITAPVMIPDTPDCTYNQGEPTYSAEEIAEFEKTYHKYKIIDLEHDYPRTKQNRGSVLKSWTTTEKETYEDMNGEKHEYPAGTWMLTSRVTDPYCVQLIEKGILKGYSSSTTNEDNADKIVANKSKTLIKDIVDPVVMTVSLTDDPCVLQSRFCKCNLQDSDATGVVANKNNVNDNGDNMEDKISKLQLIKEILGINEPNEPNNDTDGIANKSNDDDTDGVANKSIGGQDGQANDGNKGDDGKTNPDKGNSEDTISRQEFDELKGMVSELTTTIKEMQESIDKLEEQNDDTDKNDDGTDGAGSGTGAPSGAGDAGIATKNNDANDGDDGNDATPAPNGKSLHSDDGIANKSNNTQTKSDTAIVYEIMGRNSMGERIE